MTKKKVVKSASLIELYNFVHATIDKEHNEELILFLKEYTYEFNQLAPSRLSGNKLKVFNKYNLKHPSDYKNIINRIKKDVIGKDNYFYLESKEITTNMVREVYNRFKNNKDSIVYFKNSSENGSRGQLASLFIRLSNSLNHNNFIYIKDRLLIWNERNNNVHAIILLRFADFDKIVNILHSKNIKIKPELRRIENL